VPECEGGKGQGCLESAVHICPGRACLTPQRLGCALPLASNRLSYSMRLGASHALPGPWGTLGYHFVPRLPGVCLERWGDAPPRRTAQPSCLPRWCSHRSAAALRLSSLAALVHGDARRDANGRELQICASGGEMERAGAGDCAPWFRSRCRYAHPGVALRDGCSDGGGRGVFATVDIPCGTTLLAEKPLDIGGRRSSGSGERPKSPADYVRDLLFASGGDGAAALELALTVLHPVDLADVPARALSRLRDEYGQEREQLEREVAAAVVAAGEPAAGNLRIFRDFAAREGEPMLRLLLTMRFSAFRSGLYFAFAMLNHACRPNCTKFTRDKSRSSFPDCSELVATTDVAAGEELSISYLVPLEQPRVVREEALQQQHFFLLGPTPFPAECEATVGDGADPLAVARELREIGDDLGELESSSKRRMRRASFNQALTAMRDRMDRTLGPHHLLRTRLNKLIVMCCDARLERAACGPSQRELIVRQLVAATAALDGMRRLWGAHGARHHEMASLHEVCCQAIEFTLSSGDRSFQADMYRAAGLQSFSAASKVESDHRRLFKSISLLYSSS
jgi:SET domain